MPLFAMNEFCRSLGALLLCVAISAITPVQGAAAGGTAGVRWNCSVPLLPDYKTKTSKDPDVGEGVSYLYIGDKHLHSNYGADAEFTAPIDGRRGWYDSGLRLGPLNENYASVQIEISRWKRFNYQQHVALAWSVPHGEVEYRDTGLLLADGVPHRLGIFVREGLVHLLVDSRDICSTRAAYFVGSSQPKYFQVRTETSVVGSNGHARVWDLRLKRDADAVARPYASDCILHRFGIFWGRVGAGSFVAHGAFYPNEALFFTGADPATSCRT